MDSKKRINISYQWRIFIPLTVFMWALIAALMIYQYEREVTYRTEMMSKQLADINKHIITEYERDSTNLKTFMRFVGHYYENTIYDDLMVSVFNSKGDVLYQIGLPIRQFYQDQTMPVELIQASEEGQGQAIRHSIVSPDDIFFYSAQNSPDGMISVHTAMPFTASITDSLTADSLFWIIVIVLAIVVSVIVFFYTRFLGRNINILRNFANRAAANEPIDLNEKFPHNELGDISRQIVRIYRDKDRAMAKSEHEHQVALRATEEKARIKRQLTNNINHELKTPVGIIKGYLDSIMSTPDMPEELRNKFMHKTMANVERLCALLNEVSMITRLEDSQNTISISEVDYHDLVYDISNDLEISKVNGDLQFFFDIPFDCKVAGNASLLSGMLYNLIRNAATYSHGSEIHLKLIDENDKYYTFSFADDGVGVGPEHLHHLFERFYRTESGRKRNKTDNTSGTGLG
ncbi:MAG: HAMP domain-containing histidine kinase, partial [Muribaculaceae bacterium]|nr:HAMP domain-containing histidine kinase [Muribaculaceae bacterium]